MLVFFNKKTGSRGNRSTNMLPKKSRKYLMKLHDDREVLVSRGKCYLVKCGKEVHWKAYIVKCT